MGFLSSYDEDLRELLRVPMGNQVYCGVGRGLLVLHCVWCDGRGPHLELTRESQGSSPVLMWVSGFVCRFKQGVRSRPVWRHGTLLSFLVNCVKDLFEFQGKRGLSLEMLQRKRDSSRRKGEFLYLCGVGAGS